MKPMYCCSCGEVDKPRIETKGSIGLELLLWLLFLIPGVFYSVWRHTTRGPACRHCKSRQVIPPNSPIAQRELAAISTTMSPR